MPKIIVEFEVTDEFIDHCRRIKKEYGMGPQQFMEDAIYSFQTRTWSLVKSVIVDSPLQERRVCYALKEK